MKYLITGGAGFFGVHLSQLLADMGHLVHVLDVAVNGSDNSRICGFEWFKHPNILFHKGSVEDYNFMYNIMRETDVTIHMATLCLVKGLEDPLPIHRVNDVGTYNACVSALKTGNKLVYISTSEVYGHQTNFPITEQFTLNPVSLYGFTKVIGERYVKYFHRMHGLSSVIIRPFNTFGSFQREDLYGGVITSFVKRCLDGLQPIIYGSGEQTRDFTFISDTVAGIKLLSDKLGDGEVVNLGSGREVSIRKIAELIYEYCGCAGECNSLYGGGRVNDVERLLCDNGRAKDLGWNPLVSFEDGLKRYIEWYRGKKE